MNKSFEIYSDCQDIVKRLKEIDKDYFVVYNITRKTFELHNRAQEEGTFCLTLPFDCLDARAVEHARKTRVENEEKIIEEIDRENKRLEKKLINEEINRLKEALE